ncbi:MAG: shikimate kinase [Opitutales bacterium]
MASPDTVNLYLVGFAGTGKSTVGRQVARALEMTFIDSDHTIEQAQGRPVTEIFAQGGEAAFRALEREFIEQGHPAAGCVVACGGGLVVPEGMLGLLHTRGVVICLHAALETILARTAHANHRPLFQGGEHEQRVRTLYAEREPIYQRTGTMILTDRRPLRDIVAHVVRVYGREAREWASRHRA